PRKMVHVIEIIEKTWVASESRRAVDMSTTFRVPSWEELPDASSGPVPPARP
ncbi:MAG: hypothetical protein IIB14_10865, partial [Chloroflexi bacterium]|nr:hypothetical protein [Chloroflexota bacterium]